VLRHESFLIEETCVKYVKIQAVPFTNYKS